MRRWWKTLVLISIVSLVTSFEYEAISPVSETTNGQLYLDESNTRNVTPILKITNAQSEPKIKPFTIPMFNYKLIASGGGEYIFQAEQVLDYEKLYPNIGFFFDVDDIHFRLEIVNIDDEPPVLLSVPCRMDEITDYDESNSDCTYTLSDPDGDSFEYTLSINSSGNESTTFDFKKILPVNQDNNIVMMTKKQLDYYKLTIYVFQLTVTDSGGNTGTAQVVVNVIDLPNRAPIWITSFTSQRFDEKTPKTFRVEAKDEDYGINAPVNYTITKGNEEDYVSLNSTTGEISVSPIDRDANDIDTYEFSIVSIETVEPFNQSVELSITFFINDIDDSFPEIDVNTTAITVDERFSGSLPINIIVNDRDAGKNAQYNVKLMENDDNDSGIKFAKVFRIIPDTGFKESPFSISVVDPDELDIEKENGDKWEKFSIKIVTVGLVNNSMTREKTITITLNDINDEWPIFENEEYYAEVKEDIPGGTEIKTVLATDKDVWDTVTHSLVGTTANRIMKIDELTGVIKAQENAFDYDKSSQQVVQIMARDLVNHPATAQLTITILDVNNKAPRITVSNAIEVEENQLIGTTLNSTIIASDDDTDHELHFSLNWQDSYVMKNSRRDLSPDGVREEYRFLDMDPVNNEDGTVALNLVTNKEKDCPDYEKFDSLFLQVIVTDNKTEKDPNGNLYPSFDTAQILITIIDLNDNPPVFTDDTKTQVRTVTEGADLNSLVGSIFATDPDTIGNISYSIQSKNSNMDWITIDSISGELRVKGDVDADKYKDVFNLTYDCFVTDGENNGDPIEIQIAIIDTNNKVPKLESQQIERYEDQDENQYYDIPLNPTDDDRDEPFHTVDCTWVDNDDETKTTCSAKFLIEENVIKKKHDQSLNIDIDPEQYNCKVVCKDNPQLYKGTQLTSNQVTIQMTILDINNNVPEIIDRNISISENTPKGESLIVQGKDNDRGENGTISYQINSIKEINTGVDIKDLFDTESDDSKKQGKLILREDLKGHYGQYKLNIKTIDHGEPPLSQDNELELSIKKFNYNPPHFTYPKASDTIILQLDQQAGRQLILQGGQNLPNFMVTEDPDGKCTSKWKFLFKFSVVDPEDMSEMLELYPVNDCERQLRINGTYEPSKLKNTPIEIKINSTIDPEPEEGDAESTTTINFKIVFLDPDTDPIFDKPNEVVHMEFEENCDTCVEPLPSKAYYVPIENVSFDLTVTYLLFLDPGDDGLFTINKTEGAITSNNLDYETKTKHEFTIMATRDGKPNENEKSKISVEVYVIDLNDNPPKFSRDEYFGAVVPSTYQRNSVILEVQTTDADENDNATYSIIEAKPSGTGIDSLNFAIDSTKGTITLDSQVDGTMKGFFTLKILAKDVERGGLQNNSTATVKISIITEDYTVVFRFENEREKVEEKADNMTEIVGHAFDAVCGKVNIDYDIVDGKQVTTQTKATLYFINEQTSEAIPGQEILTEVSKISKFTELKNNLLEVTLILMSFTSDTPDPDNTVEILKAWLIGTAVILGSLCLILLVTLILKLRAMKKRISKLTTNKFGSQESNLNRLGINVPTANKHAIEGSNPVFNNEIRDHEIDKRSISSGDSDLIGIEDSPEFDYNNDENDYQEVLDDKDFVIKNDSI